MKITINEVGKYFPTSLESMIPMVVKLRNPDEECVILSVTKNGIYIGETYTATEISNLKQKYK